MSGVFKTFTDALTELRGTAHLGQMLDSIIAREHVAAARATRKCSAARGTSSTKHLLETDLDGLPLAFTLKGRRIQQHSPVRFPALPDLS